MPRHATIRIVGAALLAVGCSRSDAKRDASDRQQAPSSNQPEQQAEPVTARSGTAIVVNSEQLSEETVQQLQQVYPVAIPAGRYWYDAMSGAWGHEGEPIAGQMMAGLRLGGPLAATASRGTSGVYINGRQITLGEKGYIETLCQTPVIPGRYWIAANGVGGYEGSPPFFNLAQCPGVPQRNNGGSSSRTYCDPNGACTTSGILGTITTAPE